MMTVMMMMILWMMMMSFDKREWFRMPRGEHSLQGSHQTWGGFHFHQHYQRGCIYPLICIYISRAANICKQNNNVSLSGRPWRWVLACLLSTLLCTGSNCSKSPFLHLQPNFSSHPAKPGLGVGLQPGQELLCSVQPCRFYHEENGDGGQHHHDQNQGFSESIADSHMVSGPRDCQPSQTSPAIRYKI